MIHMRKIPYIPDFYLHNKSLSFLWLYRVQVIESLFPVCVGLR